MPGFITTIPLLSEVRLCSHCTIKGPLYSFAYSKPLQSDVCQRIDLYRPIAMINDESPVSGNEKAVRPLFPSLVQFALRCVPFHSSRPNRLAIVQVGYQPNAQNLDHFRSAAPRQWRGAATSPSWPLLLVHRTCSVIPPTV